MCLGSEPICRDILLGMADELTIDGKQLISSRRAAEMSGYAQDYVGQLARSGSINAKRIGGLWYVEMSSLTSYKTESEKARPQIQVAENASAEETDTLISFDGKDYISASRASELSGYNQDYIGQLARGSKIPSRQIGNRWYVDRQALLEHKESKDALLAAVQSEALGIHTKPTVESATIEYGPSVENFYTYNEDKADLIPHTKDLGNDSFGTASDRAVSIRKMHQPAKANNYGHPVVSERKPAQRGYVTKRLPTRQLSYAMYALAAVVIVGGSVLGLKTAGINPLYAFGGGAQGTHLTLANFTASVAEGWSNLGDTIENFIIPEIIYEKK